MLNSSDFLSKIILLQAILISLIVFLTIPSILEKKSDNINEINIASIRDSWQEGKASLPIPTVHAIFFTEHRFIRWFFLSISIIAGVLIEMRCKNKIFSGTYHSVHLMFFTFLGAYLLIGCLAPFIPL